MYDDTNSSVVGLDLRKVVLKQGATPFSVSGIYSERILEYSLHEWDASSNRLGPRGGEMAIRQWREVRNGHLVHESFLLFGLLWAGQRLI